MRRCSLYNGIGERHSMFRGKREQSLKGKGEKQYNMTCAGTSGRLDLLETYNIELKDKQEVSTMQTKEVSLVAQMVESACNVGYLGSTPGLGRSPGEGNGNSLPYSCLENPMDGGAWWTTVSGIVKQSDTT